MGIILPKGRSLESVSFEDIPRIEYSEEAGLSHDQRIAIGMAMVRAMKEWGLVVLTLDPKTTEIIDDTLAAADTFFQMPPELRMHAADPEHEAGYRPWGHAQSTKYGLDRNMSALQRSGIALPGREYQSIANLDDTMTVFRHFGAHVMSTLLFGLAAHYQTETNPIDFALHSIIQTNSYTIPTQEEIWEAAANAKDPILAKILGATTVESVMKDKRLQDPHGDGTGITLMARSTRRGLMFEVEGSEGTQWVPVALADNELTVAPSAGMYLATGGEIPDAKHYVINTLEAGRRTTLQDFIDLPPGFTPFVTNAVNEGIDIHSHLNQISEQEFGFSKRED